MAAIFFHCWNKWHGTVAVNGMESMVWAAWALMAGMLYLLISAPSFLALLGYDSFAYGALAGLLSFNSLACDMADLRSVVVVVGMRRKSKHYVCIYDFVS